MGVWIETEYIEDRVAYVFVAPLVGVWIETYFTRNTLHKNCVAPLVGVWIETRRKKDGWMDFYRRSPRGSVD